MRNLCLEIEYDGTNYSGWQVQKNCRSSFVVRRSKKTIQGVIEKTLRKVLQEKVKLVVAGRTDAGVHAKAQVANFKTKSKILLKKLQWALNGLLPGDISVSRIREVPLAFHSRFNAKSKAYRYSILNRAFPSVFLRNTSYFFPYPLDISLMRRESKALLGRHDFSAFKAAEKKERDPVKNIKRIKIDSCNGLVYIDIEADGFLYNMVRNICGTLIDAGRGKIPRGGLKKILLSRDRKLAGVNAPAKGLCLLKVKY